MGEEGYKFHKETICIKLCWRKRGKGIIIVSAKKGKKDE